MTTTYNSVQYNALELRNNKVMFLSHFLAEFNGLINIGVISRSQTVAHLVSLNVTVPFLSEWWFPGHTQRVLVHSLNLQVTWGTTRGCDGKDMYKSKYSLSSHTLSCHNGNKYHNLLSSHELSDKASK